MEYGVQYREQEKGIKIESPQTTPKSKNLEDTSYKERLAVDLLSL